MSSNIIFSKFLIIAVKYSRFEDDHLPLTEELHGKKIHELCDESLTATPDFHPENLGYQFIRVTLGITFKCVTFYSVFIHM